MKPYLAGLLTICLVVMLFVLWRAGTVLVAPANGPIPAPPRDLDVNDVQFGGVNGWLVPGAQPGNCVVLMHGVRANRAGMIARARLFRRHGYTVLLFDFQAHGESSGKQITFGYRESANAHAAVKFLRSKLQCRKLVAVGRSLGGAASLLGDRPLQVDALILESVYPTIEAAVANRLVIKLGDLGHHVAPLLTWQLPVRLDISLDQLRPIDAIRHVTSPILVIGGSADQHTLREETYRLHASAPAPKELWVVEGADHADIYEYAGPEYERQVFSFIQRHIGR